MTRNDPVERAAEIRFKIEELLAAAPSEVFQYELRLDGLRTLEAHLLEASPPPLAA